MEDNLEEQRSKLRKSMMGLLARREHSRLELFQKMQIKGFCVDLINSNLDEFTKRDWQSDRRYSEMLVHSRILKCHGPIKITQELRQKGLTDDIILGCLTIDENWSKLALQSLTKKYSTQVTDQQQYQKRYRFLLQRGFSTEQIKWAMKNHS